jgi:hypothetical protein
MTEAEWLACADPEPMLAFLPGRMGVQDVRLPSGAVVQAPMYPECRASDRTLRLFSCACCRRLGHLLSDERSRRAVEVTEQFVDGLATRQQFLDAAKAAQVAAERHYEAVWQAATAEIVASTDPDAANWVHGAHECASSASAAAHAAMYAPGVSCCPDEAGDVVGKATFAVAHAVSPLHFAEDCHPDFERREAAEGAERKAQAALLRDVVGSPFRPLTLNTAWQAPTVLALAHAAYDNRILPDGTLDRARLAVLADALEESGCTNADILAHCRQPGEHVRGCWVVDLLLGKE